MRYEERPTLAEAQADEYYGGPALVEHGIRCAHCKGRHATVADVRWCKDVTDEAHAEAAAEQEWEAAGERALDRALEARAERGGPDHEADAAEAWAVPPPIRNHEALTYAGAIGYAGECEDGHCDVYNRCKKHRAQDAASGVRNAMTKSYND